MTQKIATPEHTGDASFSLANWIGSIGGAALPVVLTDPNVVAPDTAMVFHYSVKRDGIMNMGGPLGGILWVWIANGTSMTARLWFYDDSQAKWIPFGGPQTMVFASANAGTPGGLPQNMSGGRFYIQITANTGVSLIGVDVS